MTAAAAAALRAAAAIGPYFAVELDAVGPEWIEFTELLYEPEIVRERVGAARQLLAERCRRDVAAIDGRAAASIQFLGIAARLVSPVFAATVLTGTVPGLAPPAMRCQRVAGGPIPFAVSSPPGHSADTPAALAALVHAGVLASVVAPLVDTFRAEFRLSAKVLWGNVASAAAGAAKMFAVARPDLAQQATELADHLLCTELLAGAGCYVRPDPSRPERFFVRDNCCLFYRIPGGGTCADCVLVPDAVRQARWRDELGRP